MNIGFLNHEKQRFFSPSPRFKKAGEITAFSPFGDLKANRPDPSCWTWFEKWVWKEMSISYGMAWKDWLKHWWMQRWVHTLVPCRTFWTQLKPQEWSKRISELRMGHRMGTSMASISLFWIVTFSRSHSIASLSIKGFRIYTTTWDFNSRLFSYK